MGVNVAPHSPFMDPLREDLLERLSGLQGARGTVAMHSSPLGTFLEGLPHPILLSAVVDTLDDAGSPQAVVASTDRSAPDEAGPSPGP